MAEENFVVRYSGEAIQEARIDARDLGMSLVGLADLLKAVQATQPELKAEQPVSLDIRATEDGSFIVDLILVGVGNVWDFARHALNSPDMTAALNLTVLLGLGQGVLKWIAKHGIPTVDHHQQIDADTVRVWTPDGTAIEMPSDVFLAIRSDAVIEAAAEAVRPLEREGIDSVEITSGRTEVGTVTISKDDLPRFERSDSSFDDLPDPEEEVTWVNFLGVSLDGSGKYRVDDGEREYQAQVADAEFLEAVLAGRVQFGAGDEVEVTMTHEPYRTRKQVRIRHVLNRVHKLHRPGASALIWDESRDRKRK